MPSATTDWDATTYHRLAAPQERWARKVLERLPLAGHETVLDAGCGSGRATELLLERLPTGLVIGVDGSDSMIVTASRELAAHADRVRLLRADLLELAPGSLREGAGVEAVDAVFSNATFHWIADHERLFTALHSILLPGGRLVAQCGGQGNVEAWRLAVEQASGLPPFSEHVGGFRPWSFYRPDETAERLERAGFEGISCWLERVEPVAPDDPREFVAAVGLAAHLERLPPRLRDGFIDAVVEALPNPAVFEYVRLNIDASRPR